MSESLAQRYELQELVGSGGMADVYRAHDARLARTVAVKLFRSYAEPETHRRFDDEAVVLARLAHPGLVAIFDVGSIDDRPFLVMEFVEGTSLLDRLATGPLPPEDVMHIGAALADGLAHAHERGVVHRDVKPSNIMLDQNGLPHLTDFGIALRAGAVRLTNANQIIGTPAYLAPEQLTGNTVGPAADVYALALVLIECLTGRIEYLCDSDVEAALARLEQPPQVPEGLPPVLADLLLAMTRTEPADRPTAAECTAQLLPQQPPAPPATDNEPAPWWAPRTVIAARPPMPRSRRRALAASTAGIASAVAAMVLLLSAHQPAIGHPPTGTGHVQNGAAGAGQPTSANGRPGQTTGPRNKGTLVANEHPAATTASAPSPVTSSAPGQTTSAPADTSTQTTPPSAPPTTTTAGSTTPTTPPPPTTTPANGQAPEPIAF